MRSEIIRKIRNEEVSRRIDVMEHNRGEKNQMGRPHLETQWISEECNRRKNRGRSPQRKAKGHWTNTEESTLQEIPGSKPTSIG
jgi:cellulase/cellobiase CelA1